MKWGSDNVVVSVRSFSQTIERVFRPFISLFSGLAIPFRRFGVILFHAAAHFAWNASHGILCFETFKLFAFYNNIPGKDKCKFIFA